MTEDGRHPPFLVVGHLNKAHGRKGELFVWPLTDYPDTHFVPGAIHHAGDASEDRPSPSARQLTIESVRPYRKGFLARFEGVGDRSAAEELRGLYLMRPFETVDGLAEGEVFYHELLGAAVVTVDGAFVGEVREVFPLKPADLLQVAGPEGEAMIPFIREVVVEFERVKRRVVIDPPQGLLGNAAPRSAG